jgi:hypothetical protein
MQKAAHLNVEHPELRVGYSKPIWSDIWAKKTWLIFIRNSTKIFVMIYSDETFWGSLIDLPYFIIYYKLETILQFLNK